MTAAGEPGRLVPEWELSRHISLLRMMRFMTRPPPRGTSPLHVDLYSDIPAAGMTTGAKTIEGAPVKPSTGRIVHYVSYGTPGGEYSRECRAAVVTEVVSDRDDRLRGTTAGPP